VELDDFLWAFATVRSRSVEVDDGDGDVPTHPLVAAGGQQKRRAPLPAHSQEAATRRGRGCNRASPQAATLYLGEHSFRCSTSSTTAAARGASWRGEGRCGSSHLATRTPRASRRATSRTTYYLLPTTYYLLPATYYLLLLLL
jgi:hypothetical protein